MSKEQQEEFRKAIASVNANLEKCKKIYDDAIDEDPANKDKLEEAVPGASALIERLASGQPFLTALSQLSQ